MRLPFSGDSIPGEVMEFVFAHVREASVLNSYDFIDVYSESSKCGWQIKSTKQNTPVTWKRAKIPNKSDLIEGSRENSEGRQILGNAIIDFCNIHAQESMELFDLDEIGYSRLILHEDAKVTYFERTLCTKKTPLVFNREDFVWNWSEPKKTKKKEQLQAFHGTHIPTGNKWWAWHGLGENQLHFSGEDSWWPNEECPHAIRILFPPDSEKLSLENLVAALELFDASN